jgi:hypothetical protein
VIDLVFEVGPILTGVAEIIISIGVFIVLIKVGSWIAKVTETMIKE